MNDQPKNKFERSLIKTKSILKSADSRAAKNYKLTMIDRPQSDRQSDLPLENSPWGEPAPIQNDLPGCWEAVIEDMKSRDRFGREKYGTALQPNNGRNALQDAYEEVLDLAVYLKQKIMEEEMKDVERKGTKALGNPGTG